QRRYRGLAVQEQGRSDRVPAGTESTRPERSTDHDDARPGPVLVGDEAGVTSAITVKTGAVTLNIGNPVPGPPLSTESGARLACRVVIYPCYIPGNSLPRESHLYH